jgi:GTP-binding protein
MTAFAHAAFMRAVARAADLPPPGPPEIAFAGRSNVGKSSAINALVGRKSLARTSKTPGRTQAINFYALGEDAARLADLPGYGYARVPHALREQWRQLVGAYLAASRPLAGIVVVMDARHALTALDLQLIAWLGERRLLLVLSKADKLSKSSAAQALLEVQQRLHRPATLFSSVTRQGVDECRDLLERWLEAGRENKKPPVKGM